jgi:tetratricopeptide (TPR) repeat protein
VILLFLTYRPGAPQISFSRRITLMIPYGVGTLIYMAMRITALGFVATNQNQREASYIDWISLGFRAFGEYVWLALVPYPLMAYRLVAIHLSDRLVPTVIAAVAVLALAALAWAFRRRFPDGLLWFASFFVSLIPVFYFKGISNAFMSDRYLYVPSIIAILFALSLIQRGDSKTWIGTGWAIVAVFTGASILRNQVWSSPEALYTTTLARDNNVAEFHISLSDILLKRNDDPGVLLHLQEALRILEDPTYSQATFDKYRVRIGLAAVLLRAHRYDDAQSHLTAAATINPRGEWTAVYTGALLMDRDQNDEGSIPYFLQAIKLNPNNEVTYDYLGTAYFNLGRLEEALAAFKKAVELNPNHDLARQHLALVQKKIYGQ